LTGEELQRVTEDLPGPRQGAVAGLRRGARGLLVGLLGQSGRWPFPALCPRVLAVAAIGEVIIDLCHTPLTAFETDITAVALAGEVRVIVPAGVRIQTGRKVAVLGYTVDPCPVPGLARALAPVVRINAIAVLGDVRIEEEEDAR
jgi:hypothetical protein